MTNQPTDLTKPVRNVAEPEPTEPDDWAIEEALKRVPFTGWLLADVRQKPEALVSQAVIALARMIQKYEPHLKPKPAVDPDVLAVREIFAAWFGLAVETAIAEQYRAGGYDHNPDFLAAVEAFKRVKGGAL